MICLYKSRYDVKAPHAFPTKQICKTVVTRTTGTKLASDGLKNRVFSVNIGDLKPNAEEEAYRKFKFRVEDVQGRSCLTNFYGMELTRDKLNSLVRKWQTSIEAQIPVTTADGFQLRVFVVGFTKRRPNQVKKTSYAQTQQVKKIRAKINQIVAKEAAAADLMGFVNKLMTDVIGKEIEKSAQSIFPLQNVFIRKVKTVKAGKLDTAKLVELHGGAAAVAALGQVVARTEDEEEAAPSADVADE